MVSLWKANSKSLSEIRYKMAISENLCKPAILLCFTVCIFYRKAIRFAQKFLILIILTFR